MAEDWGYNEVRSKCRLSSDRVQNNKIGACLMAGTNLVAESFTVCKNRLEFCR